IIVQCMSSHNLTLLALSLIVVIVTSLEHITPRINNIVVTNITPTISVGLVVPYSPHGSKRLTIKGHSSVMDDNTVQRSILLWAPTWRSVRLWTAPLSPIIDIWPLCFSISLRCKNVCQFVKYSFPL